MASPTDYNSKIQTLKEQFYPILTDYKQAFVNSNKYPDVGEYQSIYASTKSNLDTVLSGIFSVKTGIENDLETLRDKLLDLEKKITYEKSLNTKLTKQYGQLTGDNNGSDVMLDDSKNLYQTQYVANVTLFIGIFLLTSAIYKVFKQTPMDVVASGVNMPSIKR
jgi:peptidoglycan hydrolase CwlO-like protein